MKTTMTDAGQMPQAAATGRHHGGPDQDGAAPWDFSVCANAAGPCPLVVDAVRAADIVRYTDPRCRRLREHLAQVHDVAPERILIAASASEFIQRITAVAARLSVPGASVQVPVHAYGDYAAAARAWEFAVVPAAASAVAVPAGSARLVDTTQMTDDETGAVLKPASGPALRWCAEPSSPLGCDQAPPADPGAIPTVLDAVYAPLRLHGEGCWRDRERDAIFVLHGPNKALGLCGLRGAYAIAPADAAWDVPRWVAAIENLCPSWPLSAHGVAMLEAWCLPAVRQWVDASLPMLGAWRDELVRQLIARGFEARRSTTPFFCVRPPGPDPAALLADRLRVHGVKVRDAASFGLPGWWRLSAQPPAAMAALLGRLDER